MVYEVEKFETITEEEIAEEMERAVKGEFEAVREDVIGLFS